MIVTTPKLGDCIIGMILHDTIRQGTRDGTPFLRVLDVAAILPGIKVDSGRMIPAGAAQRAGPT